MSHAYAWHGAVDRFRASGQAAARLGLCRHRQDEPAPASVSVSWPARLIAPPSNKASYVSNTGAAEFTTNKVVALPVRQR
jgi:hypothetical protein